MYVLWEAKGVLCPEILIRFLIPFCLCLVDFFFKSEFLIFADYRIRKMEFQEENKAYAD